MASVAPWVDDTNSLLMKSAGLRARARLAAGEYSRWTKELLSSTIGCTVAMSLSSGIAPGRGRAAPYG
jgi:hypothetical protein